MCMPKTSAHISYTHCVVEETVVVVVEEPEVVVVEEPVVVVDPVVE